MERETLLHKTPKGEFECLIWERHMNKYLSTEIKKVRQENGKLQSEMQELTYNHKREMVSLTNELRKTNIGQLVAKKKRLTSELATVVAKNKKLRRENDELMTVIIDKNKKSNSDKSLQ